VIIAWVFPFPPSVFVSISVFSFLFFHAPLLLSISIIAPEIVKPEILLIQKKYIMVALVESIV